MIDQHIHTIHSPDASPRATMHSHMETARAKGLSALTFTDHVDFDSPVDLFKTLPDYDAIFNDAASLRTNAPTPRIGVGVELGWQTSSEASMRALVKRYDFDYVIMSLHVGDGLDFHNGDFFAHYGREEGFKRYFQLVLESLKTYDDFDVYGHIDYISRYAPNAPYDYGFKTHEKAIETILETLIARGKGIELNTSGWRYGLEAMHPKKEVLQKYYALGGRTITLGSDAHDPEYLAADFEAATSLLKTIGFTHICQFIQRECQFVKI